MRSLRFLFSTILLSTATTALSVSLAHADQHGHGAEDPGNIVEVARGAGDFNTLLTALEAAGLAETLAGDGPFTVFAPTDEAFAMLPEGTLDSLLADPEALGEILTYHVVAGNLTSSDVAAVTRADTLQGSAVSISAEDGVTVDDASVVAADIEASNGVIHVIDKVLTP